MKPVVLIASQNLNSGLALCRELADRMPEVDFEWKALDRAANPLARRSFAAVVIFAELEEPLGDLPERVTIIYERLSELGLKIPLIELIRGSNSKEFNLYYARTAARERYGGWNFIVPHGHDAWHLELMVEALCKRALATQVALA